MTFPKDFTWGGGVSPSRAWGPSTASDQANFAPSANQDVTGQSLGWPAQMADDLGLLANLGMNAIRLAFDWSRVEPNPGSINTEAVENLRLAASLAHQHGLKVWGCLHDWDLPGWFSVDERGWEDEKSRNYFWARYVETAGELFGDLVHGWIPNFEPNRWSLAKASAKSLEAALLANIDAALRLKTPGTPVASAHWLVPAFAARVTPDLPPSPEAEVLARHFDAQNLGCWLRLIREGTLEVPGRAPIEMTGAIDAFDIVGFTYRHAVAVRGDGALLPYPQNLAVGHDGTVPWPEGFAISLHRLVDEIGERTLSAVAIGAMGTSSQGAQNLRDVLALAADAVGDGVNLDGLWFENPIGSVDSPPTGLLDADRSPSEAGELWSSVAHGDSVPS